jgi:hypothetical protein
MIRPNAFPKPQPELQHDDVRLSNHKPIYAFPFPTHTKCLCASFTSSLSSIPRKFPNLVYVFFVWPGRSGVVPRPVRTRCFLDSGTSALSSILSRLPGRVYPTSNSKLVPCPKGPRFRLFALQDNRCSTRRLLADRQYLLILR